MASNLSNILQEDSKDPPRYEAAINAPTSDSPPSYDSLMTRIKKAKQESTNPVGFLSSVIAIICGSLFVTVLFSISLCLPIAMIVIGAIYKDNCTIQDKIPIWLIVSGSVGCLSSLIRTAKNCYSIYKKPNNNENDNQINKKSCLTSLIEIFLLAWFICGNVWVYSIRNSVVFDDSKSSMFCDKTVYLFSFWVITATYIVAIFCCCCCCCILVIAGCGLSMAGAVAEN